MGLQWAKTTRRHKLGCLRSLDRTSPSCCPFLSFGGEGEGEGEGDVGAWLTTGVPVQRRPKRLAKK